MNHLSRVALVCLLSIGVGWQATAAPIPVQIDADATIHKVSVLGRGNDVEIEVLASHPVAPEVQVVTDPDRLVIDFPHAQPGRGLRAINVNRGEVKAVRVGLFAAKPPVTRVVVDLKTPQRFELFPSGNTVIVKVGGAAGTSPASAGNGVSADNTVPPGAQVTVERIVRQPPLQVSFQNGLLSVRAEKATLAAVLFEIQRQTGAEIDLPAGSEQEKVTTDVGPGLAKEVLATLLNGSHYNFIILGSDKDSRRVERVILRPGFAGAVAGPNFSSPPSETVAVSTEEVPDPAPPPPGMAASVPLPSPPDQNLGPGSEAAPPPP